MKLKALFIATVACMAIAACSNNATAPAPQEGRTTPDGSNDSTIYGLVCDGSNDTIVVFLRLPYDGSDPDTLNILNASHRHQVFGTLRIGDEVALLRNAADSTQADIVVVTEDLQGLWCYSVLPTLRQRADTEGQSEHQTLEQLPDSIRQLLDIAREYGVYIKSDSVAFAYGTYNIKAATTDEELPIVYPEPHRYSQWYISNGRLVLNETQTDSLGNVTPTLSDTARFVTLTADTLVLLFPDGERGYYKKAEQHEKTQ